MALYAKYKVYDGTSYIGTYPAKNEKHACSLAQQDQLITASTFRRSQPAIIFKDLKAVVKKEGEDDFAAGLSERARNILDKTEKLK